MRISIPRRDMEAVAVRNAVDVVVDAVAGVDAVVVAEEEEEEGEEADAAVEAGRKRSDGSALIPACRCASPSFFLSILQSALALSTHHPHTRLCSCFSLLCARTACSDQFEEDSKAKISRLARRFREILDLLATTFLLYTLSANTAACARHGPIASKAVRPQTTALPLHCRKVSPQPLPSQGNPPAALTGDEQSNARFRPGEA